MHALASGLHSEENGVGEKSNLWTSDSAAMSGLGYVLTGGALQQSAIPCTTPVRLRMLCDSFDPESWVSNYNLCSVLNERTVCDSDRSV